MSYPTLSIVETIWNLPVKMLRYNLETLTHQTVPPLEIVMVNASPDKDLAFEAMEVCAQYPLVRMVNVVLPAFNLSKMFNIGIRSSAGEYVLTSSIDQMYSTNFLEEVHKYCARPNFIVGSFRNELPAGFDLGDPNTLLDRWDEIMAHAVKPTKCPDGTIICTRREWMEKVHGYDEVRTPYNYCDADLIARAQKDGMHHGAIPYGDVHVLHVYHPYRDELYYGLGGSWPDDRLPVTRNTNGWGMP